MTELNTNFETMARSGFFLVMVVLGGIALVFFAWNIAKAIARKRKEKRPKKKRSGTIPEKHDPNKWEREWQADQRKEARRKKDVTPEQRAQKKKEMEEKRELYRMQRKQDQWKR